ncbi:hypothetical protein H312_03316 [Anncaliia algerae PRA339]|uniref:Uncharacterized protein n=1 Tax=Anncaliia algerae PRA339 TaxID=1288291 RepID=A0A059EW74_9MICR|nr:hypothetical protein H312_03316 [Anncaliia algerae PRA339]
MEYYLCNTDTEEEEGELKKKTPLELDIYSLTTRNLYNKQIYIGPNDNVFPPCTLFPQRTKKCIKDKLSTILAYANMFKFVKNFKEDPIHFNLAKKLKIMKEKCSLISSTGLIESKEIPNIKHTDVFNNTFLNDVYSVINESTYGKSTIVLTDRTLYSLKKYKTPFTVSKYKDRNVIIFSDPFIIKDDFWNLLKFYGRECLAQELQTKEIRRYACKDVEIVVISYTAFKHDDKIFRVYFNFDSPINKDVIVEHEKIKLVLDYEIIDNELDILMSLDFSTEGEFYYENNLCYSYEAMPETDEPDLNYMSIFYKVYRGYLF